MIGEVLLHYDEEELPELFPSQAGAWDGGHPYFPSRAASPPAACFI